MKISRITHKGSYGKGLKVLLGVLSIGALAGVGVGISSIVNSTNNTRSVANLQNTTEEFSAQLARDYVATSELDGMLKGLSFLNTGQPLTAPITTLRTTFEQNELTTKKNVDDQVSSSISDYTRTTDLYTRTDAAALFVPLASITTLAATVATLETTADFNTKLGAYTLATGLYTRAQANTAFGTIASVNTLRANIQARETTAEFDAKLGAYTLTTGLYTRAQANIAFGTTASVNTLRANIQARETTAEFDAKLGAYTPTGELYTRAQANTAFGTIAGVAALNARLGNYETSAQINTKLAEYTKTSDLQFLLLSGGQLTGPVSLAAVNGVLPTPTLPGHLTTKKYVDDSLNAVSAIPTIIPANTVRIDGVLHRLVGLNPGETPTVSPVGLQANTFYRHTDGTNYIIRRGDNPATNTIVEDYYLEKATFSITAGSAAQFFTGLVGGIDANNPNINFTQADLDLDRITDYDNPTVTDKTYGNSAQNIGDINFVDQRRYVFWTRPLYGVLIGVIARYQAADGSLLLESQNQQVFVGRTYVIATNNPIDAITFVAGLTTNADDTISSGRHDYGVNSAIRITDDNPTQLAITP